MENILELLKTDNFLIALSVIVILLVIGLVVVIIKFNKISKKIYRIHEKIRKW